MMDAQWMSLRVRWRSGVSVVVRRGTEFLSVERSFGAIKRADVVVLVIDAGQGVTEQDFKLAEFISQQVLFLQPAVRMSPLNLTGSRQNKTS